MNAEELLGCLDVEATESSEPSKQAEESNSTEKKRERLSAVVVGGNSKKYLGKELLLSDIDLMTSEKINKLYCKYEARLGASMTKTLGNSFINLYVMSVLKVFNVISPLQLIKDLEEDPFINHALTNTCCELYYRFGMYLAPFTAILTTARHIDFNTERIGDIEASNKTIENDE
jgi:hypothetical protein